MYVYLSKNTLPQLGGLTLRSVYAEDVLTSSLPTGCPDRDVWVAGAHSGPNKMLINPNVGHIGAFDLGRNYLIFSFLLSEV